MGLGVGVVLGDGVVLEDGVGPGDGVVLGVGLVDGVVLGDAVVVVVWPGIPSGSSVVMPRLIRMASLSLLVAKTSTSKQVV